MKEILLNAKEMRKKSDLGKLKYEQDLFKGILDDINSIADWGGTDAGYSGKSDKDKIDMILNKKSFFTSLGYEVREMTVLEYHKSKTYLRDDPSNPKGPAVVISWE